MPNGTKRKVDIVLPDQTRIEDVFNASYSNNLTVFQKNELIRAPKDKLNIFQCKLIRFVISQVLKEDNNFEPFEIDIIRLAEHLRIPKNHIYERVRDELFDLSGKRIFIREINQKKKDKNYKVFNWISYAEYKDGFIYIKLNDALKPYLIGLGAFFTAYLERTIVNLNSDISVRLYEYLLSYKLTRGPEREYNRIHLSSNEWIVDIEELKVILSNGTTKAYKDNNQFIRRVLEPNLNKICDNTDIQVDYELKRRKIDGEYHTYIIFAFLNEV